MPRRQVTHGAGAWDRQILVDQLRAKRKGNARGAVRLRQALVPMQYPVTLMCVHVFLYFSVFLVSEWTIPCMT
jgi:hypothetical protein